MNNLPLPVRSGPGGGPRLALILSCIAAVCALVAAGLWALIAKSGADTPVVQPPRILWVSDPEGTTEDAAAGAAVTLSGDGLFRVDADMPPGTYRSAGPRSAPACQWARLVTPLIDQSPIQETATARDQQVVTVRPSDTALLTFGCSPWTRIR